MQPAVPGKSVQLRMRLPLASTADAMYCAWSLCEMQVSPPQFELSVTRAARRCTETCTVPWTLCAASNAVTVTKPLGRSGALIPVFGSIFVVAVQVRQRDYHCPAQTSPAGETVTRASEEKNLIAG